MIIVCIPFQVSNYDHAHLHFNPKKSGLFGRRIVRGGADSAPPMFWAVWPRFFVQINKKSYKMKVTTLTYHQRSIITTISTFLSVRPATCMDWKSRFCLNFDNFFFFDRNFCKKILLDPPIFFSSTILNTKNGIYIEVWRKNFRPKRNSVHETTRGGGIRPPPDLLGLMKDDKVCCIDY